MQLPVRVEPVDGESLRSFVTRLAAANYIRPSSLADASTTHPLRDLTALAEASGIPMERLRQLTWSGSGRPILGSRGSTGWLLRATLWWCPSCHNHDGVHRKEWELACLPVCLMCHRFLTREPLLVQDIASVDIVDAIVSIAERVTTSASSSKSRAWLARLLRVSRLLSTTCDVDWPLAQSEEVVVELHRWGHHPPRKPVPVATMLAFVVKVLNTTRERRLVLEGWRRYEQQPIHGIAATLLPRRRIQARTAPIPALINTPRPSKLDRQRVRWLIEKVGASGIRAQHLPAMMPTGTTDLLPPEAAWPHSQAESLATHMVLNPRNTSRPGWLTEALHHFDLPPRHLSEMLRNLNDGAISTSDADRVLNALGHLQKQPAIDYLRRRRILSSLSSLPRHPRAPDVPLTPHELGGWVWVYLTHGRILWTGPSWAQADSDMPTRDVLHTHKSLTLHQRSMLACFADQIWEWVSADDMTQWVNPKPNANSPAMRWARHPQ